MNGESILVQSRNEIPEDYEFQHIYRNGFVEPVIDFKNSHPSYKGDFYLLHKEGDTYSLYLKKTRSPKGDTLGDTLWNSISGF